MKEVSALFPSIYLLKVDNKNIGTRCKICSKLTKKTPEQRQWQICSPVLVSLLLTLNIFHTWFYGFTPGFNFENVIADWLNFEKFIELFCSGYHFQ